MHSSTWSNCGFIPYPETFEVCSMPPAIDGSKLPYFHEMLCNWATAYSPRFNWVALITPHDYNFFRDQIVYQVPHVYEPSYGGSWDVESGFDATFNQFTQETIGCIFANTFRNPEENIGTAKTMENRGFASSPTTTGRAYPHQFSLSFNETNSSFTDSVIRPWAIATAFRGLVARPYNESLKATITIYELAKGLSECTPSIVRKVSTYYDCAPILVNSGDISQESGLITHQCNFVFNTYNMQVF